MTISPAPVHRLVGRELDLLVAITVMGWIDEPEFGLMDGERVLEIDGPWQPSFNILHAWDVVIRMSKIEQRNAIWWNCTAGAFICIDVGNEFPKSLGRIMFDCPDKMPLAICLAALMAFGVEPNVKDQPGRPSEDRQAPSTIDPPSAASPC
jgi:hypothetical protein